MDIVLIVKAAIMGLVEGFTEFLPISSTGHLIVVGSLIDFTGDELTSDKAKAFEIIIQAGAMVAVCWEFRAKLGQVIGGLTHDAGARRFAANVLIAFLPAAMLGLIFAKHIKAVLFAPLPVALAFIVGGLVILWVERRTPVPVRIESVDDLRPLDALKIGLAQAFALIPGTSRSGATIIGGMLFGLSRRAATEFSFFLAVPTLFAATLYSLYKERGSFVAGDVPVFGVGFIFAFVSAFICVRWLLRYIATHDFTAFAWYRIAFGFVILVTAYTNLVVWAE